MDSTAMDHASMGHAPVDHNAADIPQVNSIAMNDHPEKFDSKYLCRWCTAATAATR